MDKFYDCFQNLQNHSSELCRIFLDYFQVVIPGISMFQDLKRYKTFVCCRFTIFFRRPPNNMFSTSNLILFQRKNKFKNLEIGQLLGR